MKTLILAATVLLSANLYYLALAAGEISNTPPNVVTGPAVRTAKPAPAPYDEKFMRRAIEIAQTANTTPETDPFGAVIVKDGQIVGEGLSSMRANTDVTAHGEILAIRDANRRLKRLDLSDCEIYTSCEPCPLCVAAIEIAHLRKIYYAATLKEAGHAFAVLPPGGRYNVDVQHIINEEHATINTRELPAEQKMSAESVEVMKNWAIQRRASMLK
jgi:guanine deaminase